MFHFIYAQPLSLIILIIIISIYLWYLINKYYKNNNKLLNIILLIISIIVIMNFTVLRNSRGNYYIELRPLYSFVLAKIQPEYYREMLMNIFLFVPLGLSLPFVLDIKNHKYITIILSILIGLLLTIAIEYIQYHYSIGNSEIDDVIMNTIGVILGSVSYLLYKNK